jgi:hypothetical protein
MATIDALGNFDLQGREAHLSNIEGLKVIPSKREKVFALVDGVEELVVYAGKRKSGAVPGTWWNEAIGLVCPLTLPK